MSKRHKIQMVKSYGVCMLLEQLYLQNSHTRTNTDLLNSTYS
jgi:hypothetical protein